MSWKKRRGYDNYLRWLTNELRHVERANDGDKLLLGEADKRQLEKHHGVRFRYGEYNIITMFDEYAETLIEGLKIVNRLGLKSFPTFVQAIKVNGGMYVITFTSGTKDHDLHECWTTKTPKKALHKVSEDLKILLANGYFITRYESFANSYGDIIIPRFFIRKVKENSEELHDALLDYMEFDREEWIIHARAKSF